MKVYSYESNIINVNGRNIVVLAPNKREALKFAKNHEGLKIGEKRLPVGFHYANLNNEMIRTPRNYFVNFGPLKINIH